jgi:hypothetical protein
MFRHLVLIRFTPEATAEQRQAVLDGLQSLPAQIPEIIGYHAGLDAGLREGNHDLGIAAVFADESGWRTYVDHPAHVKVITELIRPIAAERVSVQFTV